MEYITNETTEEDLQKAIDFQWELTISEIHKKYLQKLQLLKRESEKDENIRLKVAVSALDVIENFLSMRLPSSDMLFLPYKGVDKKLSFAIGNQKKIEILYQTILEIREYRFVGDEQEFLKKIYDDYTNGYSYPLMNYQHEFITWFVRYVKRPLAIKKHSLRTTTVKNSKYLKREIAELAYSQMIEKIGEFIEDIEIEKYCLEKLNELNGRKSLENVTQKIVWKGTPSQFGFIIDLLIQGGYLEKPTSSFTKDANFYLQHFGIETTSTTLAKELSEGTNSLATKNRKKITIPNKDKLD